jgi:hypothetical protein
MGLISGFGVFLGKALIGRNCKAGEIGTMSI